MRGTGACFEIVEPPSAAPSNISARMGRDVRIRYSTLEDPRWTSGLDMISYSLTGTTLPQRFGRAASGDGDHRLLGRLALLIRCPMDGEAPAAGAALKPRASLGSPNSLSSGLLRALR